MRCDEEEQALATMTRAVDIYVDELTRVWRPLLRLQRTSGWFNWLKTGLTSLPLQDGLQILENILADGYGNGLAFED